MLDKLPAEWRHITIMLLAAVLGWASTELPNLNIDPALSGLLGVVVATLVLYLTPLVRQYGIGSSSKPKE